MGRTNSLAAKDDQTGTDTGAAPDLTLRTLAGLSNAELREWAGAEARQVAAHQGRFVALVGELDRRQGWRDEGATSLSQWIVEATGAAPATARAQAKVADRLFDLPALAGVLSAGAASFDQVRTVVPVARPDSDATWAELVRTRSVRELSEAVQAEGAQAGRHSEESRRSVRFNEACRTMVAQLAPEVFSEVRTGLEARAAQLGDGETPLDERLADALVEALRVGGPRPGPGAADPYLVVAHVRLSDLFDSGGAGDELVAELERGGLISAATLARLACDATIVIGVDDDEGHTMYEGRLVRLATPTQRREILRRDRHCRFPGCGNVAFWIPHHITEWAADMGRTDLDNMCCLCEHHHALVHTKGWSLTGDANAELTFTGPSGRVMTSRPSPLWTRVTGPRRSKP
ncbi:MAG TPA: DUF222 domain-containing protein [Acidimicrobiales bacterium]|nr:DUF222 domain-containing protein [Acidimicrobiales bacterium]